jgi:hypothetical protein
MDGVVSPVDQRYEEPADAVSVTDPPSQNVVAPEGVIVAVGRGLTVTVVADEVALQPLAFVIVTLKLPLEVTSIDGVVAPFDQTYDEPALAVSVTDPPSQNVVAPDGVIVATGRALTVTAVADDVVLQPLALVTVTL